MRFEDAVVIEDGHDPAARVSIDQVFNIAFNPDRCRFGGQMRQHVRGQRRESFVFTQQIRDRNQDQFAAPDPIHSYQRFVLGGGDQRLSVL